MQGLRGTAHRLRQLCPFSLPLAQKEVPSAVT